ncbi:MAG: RRXRR domain-containing protein [Candidatus Diapherotrites archaeon]|nr:RRXRR domain-containing protein [Candidatus Diapherotrites archaeon]
MQKLSVEFKNAPGNASQVPCSVNEVLNREETLSVPCKVLADNNSDENQCSGRSRQNLRVFVLNMRGKPLMPTTPGKAYRLLKQNKAEVIQRNPFAIQLKYATGENKQNITLGIDSGYSKIGFSAITKKAELIVGEVTLRNNIKKLIEQKGNYRRTRRAKLWHREPRFDNRAKSKGWFAPSIQHKLDTHIRFIEKLKRILPITKTIIEIASFDTQKMQNPEIKGVEYQQGELQGYAVREYLLEKYKRKCAYCGKTNVPLEVEHIVPKSRGGSNRVSNLTIACHNCNQKKGNQTAKEFGFPNIQVKAKESLNATAFMNIVRKKLAETIDCETTFGYITKCNRIKLLLEKSHCNDAFVIAKGRIQERAKELNITQTRRNNRSIQLNRKGFKPSIRRQRYKLQPNDLVNHNNVLCRVKGIFNHGQWVRLLNPTKTTVNANVNNVEMVSYGKGLQFIPPLSEGVLR